jgi:hypothetical protein
MRNASRKKDTMKKDFNKMENNINEQIKKEKQAFLIEKLQEKNRKTKKDVQIITRLISMLRKTS